MQWLKNPLQRRQLRRFGHVHRMEEKRTPKKVLYIYLETMTVRGRPRNRWQNEVREDERLVGGKGWMERVYNSEEWKKLLRTARKRHILHMPLEWRNEYTLPTSLHKNIWVHDCNKLMKQIRLWLKKFWCCHFHWCFKRFRFTARHTIPRLWFTP